MAILEKPAPAAIPMDELRRFTREEYYRMNESGVFGADERLELIEGSIVRHMAPIGPSHNNTVDVVGDILRSVFGARARVRTQGSVSLGPDTEPQPDIVVYTPSDDHWRRNPTANEILLIVEVSDTSLVYDRDTKAVLYAQAGVPEYWIINIGQPKPELLVFREPGATGYASRMIRRAGDSISALLASATEIAVADVLPKI